MFSFQTMSPGQKPKRKYHLLIFSILLFFEYTGGYNTGVIIFRLFGLSYALPNLYVKVSCGQIGLKKSLGFLGGCFSI